ncbi:TetR/AcrR family transcriptional regulator [Streptomyces sp. NPDC102259]|uniref:TetR/AcrR family transcriptional regulator n=1 Tax=Streptomyces sp. NPDC102259 TaxID=3366148 RepID=UPI00380638A8
MAQGRPGSHPTDLSDHRRRGQHRSSAVLRPQFEPLSLVITTRYAPWLFPACDRVSSGGPVSALRVRCGPGAGPRFRGTRWRGGSRAGAYGTHDEQPGAGLRIDAERNRDHILAAARRLFATEGLSVSMAAVVREAGVGKATLSRRFTTRDELVDAVFADRMDGYAAAVSTALADPDPWHGFTGYVHTVCAMQVSLSASSAT